MGFGLGGIDKTENNLTQAQNSFGLQAGQQKNAMAQQEAQANIGQAQMAVEQGDIEAGLQARQTQIAAGAQMEGYASGGVEQQGTPLSVVNSTRAIGAIQVMAIQTAAQEQASLYMTQASLDQEGGLQDLMSAEGQTVINSDQNQLQQQQQQYQQNMAFLGMGVGAATGILGALKI